MSPRTYKQNSLRIALFFLLLPSITHSQQENPTGTVSGHVYCSDSNLPARLAHVEMYSIPKQRTTGSKSKPDPFHFASTQTRTDGSFTFNRIPPGDFIVSAEYKGYVRPDFKMDHDILRNPTPEQREEILKTLPNVTVAANKTVNIEIPLQRGGSISGSIRFDDGAPSVQAEVTAFLRNAKGKWIGISGLHATDDLGRFRIYSAPPGEYTLAVEMSLQDAFGNWNGNSRMIYYGDGFLERDAKTFKFTEGEDVPGIDITIPLSKLHSLSGYLLDPSGQIINAGEITLVTSQDEIEVANAHVGPEDSTFHFDFIPEGHYLLRVTNPRNVTRQTLLPPSGFVQIPTTRETPLQTFKACEAPIEVLTDLPNLNIHIAANPPSATQ